MGCGELLTGKNVRDGDGVKSVHEKEGNVGFGCGTSQERQWVASMRERGRGEVKFERFGRRDKIHKNFSCR